MKRIIRLCICTICTITLWISCDYFFSERVKIEVINKSSDNIFVKCDLVLTYNHEDVNYPFMWEEVRPQDTLIASELELYAPKKESWSIWIINKRYMGDRTLEEVIERNLFDSVRTYNHTYSYQDLRSMNFQIIVDDNLWENE